MHPVAIMVHADKLVVFAAYWAKMADFGALGSAHRASLAPLIGPKVTYANAYWAKPYCLCPSSCSDPTSLQRTL
jgi:hypothetical protein